MMAMETASSKAVNPEFLRIFLPPQFITDNYIQKLCHQIFESRQKAVPTAGDIIDI